MVGPIKTSVTAVNRYVGLGRPRRRGLPERRSSIRARRATEPMTSVPPIRVQWLGTSATKSQTQTGPSANSRSINKVSSAACRS